MNLPEFGVRRPVTNLMIFLGVIVLACYSLTRTGVDLFPEIEPPVISVVSSYPGASPEDVEIKVTEVLENQLGTTPGLEKIASFSVEEASVISLKFDWGTNLDAASNDIRDRIDLAKRFLPDIPDEMGDPFIFKFNTANIPIVFIGVTARQSFSELYDLIDKRIADSLRQLPGVGAVQFQGGGLERQINIWLDRQKLEAYDFSVLDIMEVLRRENITQPVGNLKSGLTDYLIRLPGEFRSPDELNSVILGRRNGNFVYLKDVARVEDSFQEQLSIVRINQQPGLVMSVQKQSGTNTVKVAQRIVRRLKELERFLPSDVRLNIIFDTSKDIKLSLESLKSTLWFAIFLAIFMVWFFLRRITASVIIALAIPFSLLISFIYLFLSGKTINVISLSSLAIVSGMVIDSAIVVVDNVFRHIERGQSPYAAASAGASEMFLAITASTFTTVVVFMPLLFLSGVVGKMFGELAAVVIVTLFASLWTASTFTPMLCSKWLKPLSVSGRPGILKGFHDISERWFKALEDAYSRALKRCIRHKKMMAILFFVLFICGLSLIRFAGTEFIPEEDTGDLRITTHLPVGTRLEETDKVALRIEKIIAAEVPEAAHYYVRSGSVSGIGRTFGHTSGANITSAGVKLVSKTQRKRSDKEIAQVLRREIKKVPGVIKADLSTGNPIGRVITGGRGKSIQVEIIGHSFEDTSKLAQKVKEIIERIPGAVDVDISRDAKRPELKIEVDREKAAVLGLDMKTVSESVKTFIHGSTATKYREKGETYDIHLRLEESSRSKIEDIDSLSVLVPLTGERIKLSNIAKIYEGFGPEEIERTNRERVVRVECNIFKRSFGDVLADIKKQLQSLALPQDVIINFGGEAEEQEKAFRDLGLLLVLGITMVYMVMAAQFESLLDPFIVLFAIPFTFIGVILGFLATGTTLNVVSFLGVVMLMGIVVNNAIVLISYINILRSKGLDLLEAITVGGRDRLRPVLMTTITTLAALLPLAFYKGEGSESWQPLGITMISGLSVSSFVTLFFVPTFYSILEKRRKRS